MGTKGCRTCGRKNCVLLPEECEENNWSGWIPKPQQEQVREWIKSQKENQSENHYTGDSVVSKKKERIDSLVKAHWKYQENVLSVGQDKEQLFTWEQVMAIREWDYCSSARHFYGHGYEDAQKDIEVPGVVDYLTVSSDEKENK